MLEDLARKCWQIHRKQPISAGSRSTVGAKWAPNASTSNLSLAPAGYPIRPDRVELDQLVFRIERLPDTVQSDHVDWGFNVTNVYGLDYRYTIMKGIFSDQLLDKNRTYGYDMPTFYGELYFPQIAQGMNVRVGRFLSVPDIETQMAGALYECSYLSSGRTRPVILAHRRYLAQN